MIQVRDREDFRIVVERCRAANRLVPYPDGPWGPATFFDVFMGEEARELKKKYPELYLRPQRFSEDVFEVIVGVRGVRDCSRDPVLSPQQMQALFELPPSQLAIFFERVSYSFCQLDLSIATTRNARKLMEYSDFGESEKLLETHVYDELRRAYDWVLETDELERYRIAVAMLREPWEPTSAYVESHGNKRWTMRATSLENAKRAFQTFVAVHSPIVIPLLVMVRSPLASVKKFLRRDGDHAIVTGIAQFLSAKDEPVFPLPHS